MSSPAAKPQLHLVPSDGNRERSIFEKLVTREQLAELWSVSPSFISKLMNQGLPHVRIGRAVRFSNVEVAEWLSRNRGP